MDHGAELQQNPRSVVQSALDNNEIGVVEELLDRGLNPQILSPVESDKDFSPVHFALQIGLNKDKGKLVIKYNVEIYITSTYELLSEPVWLKC